MSKFVCRFIFCAKITNCENVALLFDDVINKNVSYITGLLFIYSDFIIYLIEALEDDKFRMCYDMITIHLKIMTNIKCLYIQNDAKKRFFEKWHFKIINDHVLNSNKLEKLNKFDNVSNACKTIILNLCKLYIELWNTQLQNYESFIKYLDHISLKGHPKIPTKKEVEFVLQSCWGYNLTTLVNNYYNLNYTSNFNDYSSVVEIIEEIIYSYEE